MGATVTEDHRRHGLDLAMTTFPAGWERDSLAARAAQAIADAEARGAVIAATLTGDHVQAADAFMYERLPDEAAGAEALRDAIAREIAAAEARGYEKGRSDFQFNPSGDNHHNAERCPYCSPRRAEALAEAETRGARTAVAASLRAAADRYRMEEVTAVRRGDTNYADHARSWAAKCAEAAHIVEGS